MMFFPSGNPDEAASLPFNQAAERGATVSPSKDAAFIQNLCPADGGAGRPGRVFPPIHFLCSSGILEQSNNLDSTNIFVLLSPYNSEDNAHSHRHPG